MSKFCTNCGKELNDDANFCDACGHKFSNNSEEKTNSIDQTSTSVLSEVKETTKSKRNLYILLGIIGLFITAVIVLLCNIKILPNYEGIDAKSIEDSLKSKGFIVSTTYEYSTKDNIKKGMIISSSPKLAFKNSRINLLVSKGPVYENSINPLIQNGDTNVITDAQFSELYIDRNHLVINCTLTFKKDTKFLGFGEATFDKLEAKSTFSIKAREKEMFSFYEHEDFINIVKDNSIMDDEQINQFKELLGEVEFTYLEEDTILKANTPYYFEISIPLTNESLRPSNIYCVIPVEINNERYRNIYTGVNGAILNFYANWDSDANMVDQIKKELGY